MSARIGRAGRVLDWLLPGANGWIYLRVPGIPLTTAPIPWRRQRATEVAAWAFDQQGRVDFRGDFSLRYTFAYTRNEGVPPGINPQVTLMSMVLEKRILRDRGVIGHAVNDLFDNNVGYSHSPGEGYVEDDQSTVMGRFLLASFTWKFQQFRGGMKPAAAGR